MSECIFCQPGNPEVNTVIRRNSLAYARLDNFPLTDGHLEVVPYRHVGSVFDLTADEISAVWELTLQLHSEVGSCDGFTLGINDGPAAGQTIPHMHLHLIPRRFGDVPDPRGGVRRIFPDDEYSRGAK